MYPISEQIDQIAELIMQNSIRCDQSIIVHWNYLNKEGDKNSRRITEWPSYTTSWCVKVWIMLPHVSNIDRMYLQIGHIFQKFANFIQEFAKFVQILDAFLHWPKNIRNLPVIHKFAKIFN